MEKANYKRIDRENLKISIRQLAGLLEKYINHKDLTDEDKELLSKIKSGFD
jgi:hypothetical protein